MKQNIRIDGLDSLVNKLNKIHQNTNNLNPILNQIGNLIKNEIENNFEKESGSDNKRWKDTKNNKRARGDKVLHDTTHLSGSFSIQINTNSVEVGTNLPYARIHQFGGKAGRGGKSIIPQRSFLPLLQSHLCGGK